MGGNIVSTALAVLFTLVDSGIDVVGSSTIYPGYSFNCSKLLNRVESITQTRPEEKRKRGKEKKERKGEKEKKEKRKKGEKGEKEEKEKKREKWRQMRKK